jgi:hypothetical protein
MTTVDPKWQSWQIKLCVLSASLALCTVGMCTASFWNPVLGYWLSAIHERSRQVSDWTGRRSGLNPPPASDEVQLRAAQEKFLSWVTSMWANADPEEVARTFSQSFRKGDKATDYTAILATGRKIRNLRGASGPTAYFWKMPLPYNPEQPDSSHLFLLVYVEGEPPRILKTNAGKTID